MKETLQQVIKTIVSDDKTHARFLNSLSLMENSGARKIAAYEDKVHTDLTVLKHAAEEFRHAFYLKKQLSKLQAETLVDYRDAYLLAPRESRYFLHQLDIDVCRMLLREEGMSFSAAKKWAYLLVTYAIEVRADMLYGVYQEALTEAGSRVNVKSIIAEEEGHLSEMIHLLEQFPGDWKPLAERAIAMETRLFGAWLAALSLEVQSAPISSAVLQ